MPIGAEDPMDSDDEVVNLVTEDDDEEAEELLTTAPAGLSEGDTSQTDTRSEEDNSGVEISGAEQGTNEGTNEGSDETVQPENKVTYQKQLERALIESMNDMSSEEGINMDEIERNQMQKAIRASLEESGQTPDTPPNSPKLEMEQRGEASSDRSSPLGAIPKTRSETQNRPPEDVNRISSLCEEEEVTAHPLDSTLGCMVRLGICLHKLSGSQQEEAMAVMRYLWKVKEDEARQPRGYWLSSGEEEAHKEQEKGADGGGQSQQPERPGYAHLRRGYTGSESDETEGRLLAEEADHDESLLNGNDSEESFPSDGASKRENSGKDGGRPLRNPKTDSKSPRIHRANARLEEQRRSSARRCAHCGVSKSQATKPQNSGSLFPPGNRGRRQESRRVAEPEAKTGPRRRTDGLQQTKELRPCPARGRGHAQKKGRARAHVRGNNRKSSCGLQEVYAPLAVERDEIDELPRQRTGSNRNQRGGRSRAYGRGRVNRGRQPRMQGQMRRSPRLCDGCWS